MTQLHYYVGKVIHVKDIEIREIASIKIVSSGDATDTFFQVLCLRTFFKISSSHPLSWDTMDNSEDNVFSPFEPAQARSQRLVSY